MKRVNRSILVGVVLALCVMWLALARVNANTSLELETDVTALNSSGVTGTATMDITDGGVQGNLSAHNLVPGHGYTVWFFYLQDGATGGPGRFDSAVAESGDVTFQGHVGGLQVSSGATIKLLIFDHPDLTALPASGCTAIAPTNVARANNLLTPQCGSAVGQAVFSIP